MTFRCTSCRPKGPTMPIADGHRDSLRRLVPCRACSLRGDSLRAAGLAAAEKARGRQIPDLPTRDPPAAKRPGAEEQLDSLERRARHLHREVIVLGHEDGTTSVYARVDSDLVEIRIDVRGRAFGCRLGGAWDSCRVYAPPLGERDGRSGPRSGRSGRRPDKKIPTCPRFAAAFREAHLTYIQSIICN